MPPNGVVGRVAAVLRRTWARIRGLPWRRFAAGGAAGASALLLTFLLRLFGLGVFLPEVAVDFAVGLVPGSVEAAFIRVMGGGAKVLAFVVAVVLVLSAYGVGAVFYRRVERLFAKRRWYVFAAYTFGPALAILLVVLPLIGGGLAGSATYQGAWAAGFSQLLGAWLYAAVLDHFFVEIAKRHPEGFQVSRRNFLKWVVASAALAVVMVYVVGRSIPQVARLKFATIAALFAKEVTPTDEFYVVTKNVIDPMVDGGTWRLAIDGLVQTPRSYTYAELLAAVPMEEYATLECVSNEVGGNLISTAKWSGIPLGTLIDDSIPELTADWVLFSCADGYTVAIPLAKARESPTLLALRMNDEPLRGNHGFPARAFVPGKYGMFSAKWLTRITVVRGEVLGFWQQKGWTNRGDVRPTAIVTTPPADSVVSGTTRIGGIAYAGARGVSAVEVSTDGGASWSAATLKSPPLSWLSWVLWTVDWTPPGPGSHRVMARMVDRAGVPQEAAKNPPFSQGASGYDAITLLVP
jgi:DMSO/TMAO reductase YedYZ molybdopterin-dependent catalytic subunit